MDEQRRRLAIFVTTFLTAVYVCGAWLSVKEWNLDILDGSWEYGLRQMYTQGLYLGKDVFLTYGPLAQSLSPVIRDGQRPFTLFYVLGAVYAFFGLFALWSLLDRIARASWPTYVALAAFLCCLPLVGFSTIRGELDTAVFFWMIVAWLALQMQSDPFRRNVCLAGVFILAVTGMEIKFSFGVLGTGVFLLSLFSMSKTMGRKGIALIFAAFVAANWLLFFALTGSWGFLEYFVRGLYQSSLYSEVNALHRPHDASDLRYLLGLLACVNFVFVVGVVAHRLRRDSTSGLSIMVVLALMSSFFLFKMGFVRADQHTLLFYQTLLPILLLMYAVVSPHLSGSRLTCVALCVGFAVSLAGYHHELRLFGSGFPRQFQQTILAWREIPVRIVDGIVLLNRGFSSEHSKILALMEGYPNLSLYLNRLYGGPTSQQRSIAFAPWEDMLYHLTPSFSFSPLPTLQIYPELLVRNSPVLVDRYLSSNHRPDVIVLGPGSIDSRNSVSEFTNWLPLLYRNYRPIHFADGCTILGRTNAENADRKIICHREGPGLFLKGRIQPLGTRDALLSKLAAMLFKGSELVAVIDFEDGNGKPKRIACRSYRSQLETGAYFSDMPIGDLIRTMNREGPGLPSDIVSKIISARLVRPHAARNLPASPEEVPIDLEFCAPRGFRFP